MVGSLLLGPAFLVQAFTTPGWGLTWWVVSGFVSSFCIVWTNVVQSTIRQIVCPAPLMGRVSATMAFMTWSMTPVGSLAGGALAAATDTRLTLIVSGAVACLAVLWLVTSPLRSSTGIVVPL
jgi:hypothetical protein